jgi:hypothetical protein
LFVIDEASDVLREDLVEAIDVLGDALMEATVELRIASVAATMVLAAGSDVLDGRWMTTAGVFFDVLTFFLPAMVVDLHAHTNVHKQKQI